MIPDDEIDGYASEYDTLVPQVSSRGLRASTPPQNMEAEESVLGAMLLSSDAIAAARVRVNPEHFYDPANGLVFTAILRVADSEPVSRADAVTVAEDLRRHDMLDRVGGPSKLVALQASAPAVSNAARYAAIIEELATLRNAMGELAEGQALLQTRPDDVSAAIAAVEQALRDVRLRRAGTHRGSRLIGADLASLIEEIDYKEQHPDELFGLSTPWVDVNGKTKGLPPEGVTLVAGRPGMGKTATMLTMAWHIAHDLGEPVLFFSVEMTARSLLRRLIAQVGRVPITALQDGKLGFNGYERMLDAADKVEAAPLYINDRSDLTPAMVTAELDVLEAELGRPVRAVFVDYIQKMAGRDPRWTEYERITDASTWLSNLARDRAMPIVLGAQVGRGVDDRADKRPTLGDLRGAGGLEQDASVVMFLYRDEVYNRDSDRQGILDFIIAKHRDGETGVVSVAWMGHFGGLTADMARGPARGHNPQPFNIAGPRDDDT